MNRPHTQTMLEDSTRRLIASLKASKRPTAQTLEHTRKLLRQREEAQAPRGPTEELRAIFVERLEAARTAPEPSASLLEVARKYAADRRELDPPTPDAFDPAAALEDAIRHHIQRDPTAAEMYASIPDFDERGDVIPRSPEELAESAAALGRAVFPMRFPARGRKRAQKL